MPFLLLLSALALLSSAAEETAIVNEGKINVRGQPSLVGEVVTQLQRGDPVTVLDYVKNDHAKGGEPTNWAKIKLPSNTPVWVYAPMVKDGAVAATRLNLRAGPGDNYSVIGRLSKGDKVNPIRTMSEWIEVEAPAGAYAFVDASLIKAGGAAALAPTIETPAMAAAKTPRPLPPTNQRPEPPVVQAAVPQEPTGQPSIASTAPQKVQDALSAPTRPQPLLNRFPVSEVVTPSSSLAGNAAPPQEVPKVVEHPIAKPESTLSKRIVRREGVVRATRSIQAPTWYELISPESKKTIDYLHEEKLGIKLKELKGQKVIVSGEEAIDPRWPNTPILEMETLDIAP